MGDQSAAYGGTLKYDLRQSGLTDQYSSADVVLVGGDVGDLDNVSWNAATFDTPQLQIVAGNGGILTLSWPASATGFTLESASKAAVAENWTGIGTAPVNEAGRLVVRLDRPATTRFYRLRK